MLARKLKLSLDGLEVGTTPMLVPSISSRANIDIKKLLSSVVELVTGPLLISAYDYCYASEFDISFPELIFLDSGGYECNKDGDISDIGLYKPDSKEWNRDYHSRVVDNWKNEIPTVLISYDHPTVREPIERQINHANDFFNGKDNFLKEILIKPRSVGAIRIKTDDIKQNLKSLNSFDIIGFTEKELGYSVLERMINLAKIRIMMDKEGLEKPIHIFGSLDPITTPLYYLSGADIFDGLSWLRFVFHEGNTYYLDSFGPKQFGIHQHSLAMWGRSIAANYTSLRRLEIDLEKFQYNKDFKVFGENADFFSKSYDDLKAKIGGDINGW